MLQGLIVALATLLLSGPSAYSNGSGKTPDAPGDIPGKSVRVYNTTRLSTDRPSIDGKLDDACWKTGEWAGDYTQWIPKEGAKPSQPTQLKVLYDDRNIYVAIRAFDSEPQEIIQKAGRRDEFNGDVVGINFDSYHDHRTGFEFNITAAGQKIELVLTNPMDADASWNAVWSGKVGLEDSAWTAEFEIPLSQLRYSSEVEQVWGMHSWRWIDRFQEESDWEPQTSTGPGILYQFGELHGIKGLPASRRIELMPYSVGKLRTFKSEPGNPFAEKGRSWFGSVGVDAKIGLSSNFTADLSVNPDFGQVESDPSVMNLTAFETFYEERRPFFLEGKTIFNFDSHDASLFYSRRIGHAPSFSPSKANNEYTDLPDNTTILSAAKISGKTADGLAVGVLHSLTANEQVHIRSNGTERALSAEPLTNYMIARVQKDFEQGNTIVGGIVTSVNRFIEDTHLDFLNQNAFTGGLDLLHHWNDKEFYVDVKLVGSTINGSTQAISILQNSSARYYQRPDQRTVTYDDSRTTLSGYGGGISVGKGSKGLWRYSTDLNWRSPGLDLNDIGFMQRADIISQENEISYFVNQPVSIFRTYSLNLEQFNNWDFGLTHLSSGARVEVHLEFLNNWAISANCGYTAQALDTRLLRGGHAMLVPAMWDGSLYIRTDPSERVFFGLTTSASRSGGHSAQHYSVEPDASVTPFNTLRVSVGVNYSSNTDNLQYVGTKSFNDETRYILGKIHQHTLGATFRIDFNITPELSIQYYGSPFASVGTYSEFKTIRNPVAPDYAERYSSINPVLRNNNYDMSESNNGHIDYSFWNPDFTFSQFRSNLVFRWEYRPGSHLYVVWSQEKTAYLMPGGGAVSEALGNLQDLYPGNIFLAKCSYWFSL